MLKHFIAMIFNRNLLGALLLLMVVFFNSCKKSSDNSPLPKADFTYTMGSNQALPDTINFTNTSLRGTTYKWYFDTGLNLTSAGATTPNASFIYTASNYTSNLLSVKLVVSNSFGKDSVTKQVSLTGTIITSVSTNSIPNGAAVITGINFGTNLAGNHVLINGVNATITAASSTSITFIVPPNATSGKLTLTTNGVSISTNFTLWVLSIVAPNPGNQINIKRISYYYQGSNSYPYNYNDNTYGVGETDTLFDLLHSKSGAAGQYVGTTVSYQPYGPGTINWLGIAANYLVGSNYNIYKIGTQMLIGGVASYTAFAGNGTSGYADGTGSAAQFVAPFGIATDAAGNVYVTDSHRVRKITAAGVVTTLAGSGADGNSDGQGTSATFGSLWGITVDALGNVFVSDTKYHNIRKITPTGAVTTFAGSGTAGLNDGTGIGAQFSFPKGLAFDFGGNLFVADSNFNNALGPYTSVIRMINPLGLVATVLSSARGDALSNPDGIAFGDGTLSICNTGPTNQSLLYVSYVAK